jgi:hypothetical protein
LGTEAFKTRRARAVAFTLALLLTSVPIAQAQVPNNSWTGLTDTTWTNGGNWTGSTPATTDIVGFNVAGAPNQPTLDIDPTVAGMLMNATGNNTLTLNAHTLTLTGVSTQSGGTITGAGTVSVGTYNMSGGTITGGATLSVNTLNYTGGSLNTAVAERTTVYLRYDGDLAGGNTNHVLSAGVRYVW